jgi:hypothetical protein
LAASERAGTVVFGIVVIEVEAFTAAATCDAVPGVGKLAVAATALVGRATAKAQAAMDSQRVVGQRLCEIALITPIGEFGSSSDARFCSDTLFPDSWFWDKRLGRLKRRY